MAELRRLALDSLRIVRQQTNMDHDADDLVIMTNRQFRIYLYR